jgi:seryl-tRNA synthetase
MLDIKFIREHKDIVKLAAQKKRLSIDIDQLLILDEKRRTLTFAVDELRRVHKSSSDKTASLTGSDRDTHIAALKAAKDEMGHKEFELRAVDEEFNALMLLVPNVPDLSVPDGVSDVENQEVRVWGTPKNIVDLGGKDYMSLMGRYDMVDLERGSKVAGFRGYFLKNDGAMLVFALWRFTLDHLIKKGFVPILAPSLVKRENFLGTGWFPQAEEDVYKTQDDLYLSGTAEVPMMGYHAGETLTEEELPKKYVAFSPCFRREAGSYGKDEKGIYRVHEFFKVEQVVLCRADHEESVRWHEELTKNSEEIMQLLEIPYHVVLNCGGDLGLGQVKKYDIEGWLPSEGRYRETHSASYFHDFQTRRLNIKYRTTEGEARFLHSLNNTAIATPRILEAFLENHQNQDESISIPAALEPYFGKDTIKK